MESNNPIGQYLDVALRRKWLILPPFLLGIIVSLYLCATLPPIFKSETTILVEPQQVPENYVQSTVTGSVQDRLNTISQQILSRTRLESVIKELGLYAKLEGKASREEIVNTMRQNIEIKVESQPRRREATAAFRLTFYGEDPETVQRVTQKLATLYIEENLRVREAMARGTKDFLNKQLEEIEAELRRTEESIREFKQKYMGELPEQLETNLRALDQLQQQKTAVLASLRDAEDRQVMLEQQLSEAPRYLAGTGADNEDLYRQLESKRQQLTALRARYTDLYPDVIRLRKEVRDLELRIGGGKEPGAETSPSGEGVPVVNPTYARLKNQAEANRLTLESLRDEQRGIDWKMRRLHGRVENIPRREQELMTLTRDYKTIKQSYDSMMARKINAEIAEDMEIRQKSEQFRILDPANYPEKPVRPNRLRILGIGLLLGLGAGVGLALLMEFLDRSFRTVEEVKQTFTIPVLGVIPLLATAGEIRRRRLRKLAIGSLSLGFVITSVVGVHVFITRIDLFVMRMLRLFL